jgi:hypothetical protein
MATAEIKQLLPDSTIKHWNKPQANKMQPWHYLVLRSGTQTVQRRDMPMYMELSAGLVCFQIRADAKYMMDVVQFWNLPFVKFSRSVAVDCLSKD